MKLLTRALLFMLVLATIAQAQDLPLPEAITPSGTSADAESKDPIEDLSTPVKIVLLLTAMTVLPAIMMTVTSFTRIIIVLSFVRKALSVQEMPPNQVLIGLALFLTLVVMNPVLGEVNDKALQPYLNEQIGLKEATDHAARSLSNFLLGQTRDEDLVLMVDLTQIDKPRVAQDVPLHVLVPAFALSELRTAFQMGFLVYLPFLIVDLVVASVLLSMGMFMLPPVIISTPFKILLFILVAGWDLVVRALVQSFQ